MTVDALDLDDIEFRARHIQGIGSVQPSPFITAKEPVPAGISPLSSIGAAEKKKEIPQHRPALPSPNKNVMIDVINTHLKTEELVNRSAKVFDAEINKSLADIQKLATEKQEALESEARAAKSRTTWSVLATVSQYIASVGMLALSASLGGAAASFLVAAGVIGLGVQVARDTHFLRTAVAWYTKCEEHQKRITHNIEMGAFFLQLGLGLAGGFAAWQSGALSSAQISQTTIHDKLKFIIPTASQVVGVGAKIGTSYYDKQMAYLQSRLKDIDTHTTIDQQTIYHDSKKMSEMLETTQSETDRIRKSVQAAEVSFD